MPATGSREQEAQGATLVLENTVRLPKKLTDARLALGLADPDEVTPEEARAIRTSCGMSCFEWAKLLDVTERSVVNYESGKAMSPAVLMVYNVIKRALSSASSERDGAAASDRPVSDYSVDELREILKTRVMDEFMKGSPARTAEPPREATEAADEPAPATPKRPRGRPRIYPKIED